MEKNIDDLNILINNKTLNKDSKKITKLEENLYKIELEIPENQNNIEFSLYFSDKKEENISKILVEKTDFDVKIVSKYHKLANNTSQIYQKNNTTIKYFSEIRPKDSLKHKFKWTLQSDDKSFEIIGEDNKNYINLKSNKVGNAILSLQIDDDPSKFVIYDISSVDTIESIIIKNDIKEDAILSIEAIAGQKYNDSLDKLVKNSKKLKVFVDNNLLNDNQNNILKFYSKNNCLDFDEKTLKITPIKSGRDIITLEWIHSKYFNEKIRCSLEIDVVYDAVEINDYKQLLKATDDSKKIVLNKDIMIMDYNPNLTVEEFKLEFKNHKLPITFDYSQYELLSSIDSNIQSPPEIYYLIEFKNDVYGNGYSINSTNITKERDPLDITKNLFKGPTNFLAFFRGDKSGIKNALDNKYETISVREQDNISFLVRTDDITINNIRLIGCDLDQVNNKTDFNSLKLAGTVLEIMSNANIINSRIENGRNLIRAFGRELTKNKNDKTRINPVVESKDEVNPEEERIKVVINGCILSNSREYGLRLGTNRAIRSKIENNKVIEAQFTDEQNKPYDSNNKDNYKDKYFYDNYVLTDIDLKNSIVQNCGIYTVGIITHFLGKMLIDSKQFNVENCAATSYATLLNISDDVVLKGWTEIKNIDSSTLIETHINIGDEKFNMFNLNIPEMINAVKDKERNKGLVTVKDSKTYVHTGVVLYGGGRNYSCININKKEYKKFNINFSELKKNESPILSQLGDIVPHLAGEEDFVFYMCTNYSDFSIEKQNTFLDLVKEVR